MLVSSPNSELAAHFLSSPPLLAFPDENLTVAVVRPRELRSWLDDGKKGLSWALSFATIMTQAMYRDAVESAQTLEEAAEAERYILGFSRGLELLGTHAPGVEESVRQEILLRSTAVTQKP